ncbi:MAG TPA: M20/M25/M40 family metallo-hydrolase, partial [Acidobacteriota bacterium]|nr:M20/M25/M40 family metallo-hydrolase [Acidobacteriota bacterium]
FRLHVPGLAAHGAMRREGISAIEKFFFIQQAINALEWARHAGFRHPLFREGDLVAPISIGRLQAGDWPSTVPESLTAEGRFGILPGEELTAAREELETAVQRVAATDPWLATHVPRIEWFEGQFEPADTPLDAPVVTMLTEAHRAVSGSAPAVHGVPYGSDLRFFTNHANMHAVLYGPGDVALAHSMNESVPLDEVQAAAEVVALMILNWPEVV